MALARLTWLTVAFRRSDPGEEGVLTGSALDLVENPGSLFLANSSVDPVEAFGDVVGLDVPLEPRERCRRRFV